MPRRRVSLELEDRVTVAGTHVEFHLHDQVAIVPRGWSATRSQGSCDLRAVEPGASGPPSAWMTLDGVATVLENDLLTLETDQG
jgi:hypothetical protein